MLTMLKPLNIHAGGGLLNDRADDFGAGGEAIRRRDGHNAYCASEGCARCVRVSAAGCFRCDCVVAGARPRGSNSHAGPIVQQHSNGDRFASPAGSEGTARACAHRIRNQSAVLFPVVRPAGRKHPLISTGNPRHPRTALTQHSAGGGLTK